MEALFLKLFNMSITAAWVVLAVVVLRLLLKKAPKSMICFLWLLVAVRLIFPISIESVVSLIPSTETITEESLYSATPVIDSGIGVVNDRINPVISESLAPEIGASVNPMQVIVYAASYIWVIGMVGMLIYAVVSYFRLWIKVKEAVVDGERIWLCDRISTPFILGIIRPRIYIPSWVEKDDKEYVIAHERAHLKRKDHWWKPLGFLLLTVYWFNPVMWLAYVLLCKDIEYACDEKVIEDLGVECKKDYSNALVNCSVSRKSVAMCPLAFGETGVKSRIKSILNYKEPAFWAVTIGIILCIVFTIMFMTDPITIKHFGNDITKEELKENFEDCLKLFSISEVPEFDSITINEGEIRKVSLYNGVFGGAQKDYLEDVKNIMTAAIMAYAGTQYEENPRYVTIENVQGGPLYSTINRAFKNGKAETYWDQVYIVISIDSEGYSINNQGLITPVEGEKQYISWELYMEKLEPFYGSEYYLQVYSNASYNDVTPTPSLLLNEDGTFILRRGTDKDGDIKGTYEFNQNWLLLGNKETPEWYAFEMVDAYTLKFLPERSGTIKIFEGLRASNLQEEVFVFDGDHNNAEMKIDEASLYYGQDSDGKSPGHIVGKYYENLDKLGSEEMSQYFTDEYLLGKENVVYQDMRYLSCFWEEVDKEYIRESDQAWIEEISKKYKAYCFLQTKAELICEEDGPSGMKGETVNQQYYFALVLDPKDGRWKIDDFGYPGFDISESEEQDTTSYKVEKEEYELAYIIGIDKNVVLDEIEISVDYVDWISDSSQPNGFRINNPVEDTNIYLVDEDAEYQINHYFSNIYEGTLDESTNEFKVSKETFIEYQKEYGSGLFWIKVEDDKVLEFVEQYIP